MELFYSGYLKHPWRDINIGAISLVSYNGGKDI